jgi:hypothetical protein
LLKREGLLSAWHPGLLTAGAEEARESAARLDRSALIFLLISPDFLASDACYEHALQRALAIAEKVSGPEHPDTATSLNNLALLYAE